MASMNFNTENNTFRKLLGNGLTYQIPRFQRDYSWTADEWDDLWQDIIGLFDEDPEPAHYMGYLVLQSSDNKQYDIIDGQQRITTLSVMILSALSHLEDIAAAGLDSEKNRQRKDQLRNSYIGYLDPVTLIPRSKLKLNRHNNDFYQNYLIPLEKIPQRGLRASEHLLRKAFDWFKAAVKAHCGQDGTEVARFVDLVVDRLFFTVITVTDELNAFKVFETLNSRGVRLSATDLLKNYLFSVVNSEGSHEHEMKAIEERWERIVGVLGSESFPEFLRAFWNSRNKLVRKAELFKTIRKEIQGKQAAFDLIRSLDSHAHIYAALREPQADHWTGDQRKMLQQLKMFNVRQPLSLLLAAHEAFAEKDDGFNRVLRAVCVISFRYNVICNMQTNEQERVYNDVAVKISRGNISSKQALDELKRIYPEDAQFKAAFADKELRTTSSRNENVVRFILFSLERHVSHADYDSASDKYSIEHILPEHPGEAWTDYDEHRDEKFIYRLGNMTLMETKPNREIGNQAYPIKKTAYEESPFAITRKIAEDYAEWNTEKIASLQNWMARQATSVWRIDF
ncbi:MAG: DUF262 domain-containing protein [Spartobacteria bacterium]|nr:DUF262 domain-containing protein [Spartobacteria bacterium]